MCCGKPSEEVGPISWRGNCLRCANLLLEENIVGISTQTGYAYRRQMRGVARWLERALAGQLDTAASGSHSPR